MRASKIPAGSGDLLVSDFQTVLTGIAMSQYAAHEAERSEQEFMEQLSDLGRSGYLAPGSLTESEQTGITKGSVDVHVKKVQAEQLASLSTQQLNDLIAQAKPRYVGRRAMVTTLNSKNPPIEAVWFDQQSGYRYSPIRKSKLVGVIEDVRMDENLIILRPTLQRRLMTPGLQSYVIYIIDPEMLTPMVTITLT